MNNKKKTSQLPITVMVILLIITSTVRAADRPNILFLFSDDHALRTIGAYKGAINKTPNLNRIAREGAVFTNSFNVNSICCPSRAAILTGKHSHANGITGNGSKWNGKQWVYSRALGEAGVPNSIDWQVALKGKSNQ